MRHISRFFQLSLACLAMATVASLPSHAQALGGGTEHPTSKLDIYAGYGFFHPNDVSIGGYTYPDLRHANATASVAYYVNRFFGGQVEGSIFPGGNEHAYIGGCTGANCGQLMYTAQAGPIARFPLGPFVPFVHGLVGETKMNGPAYQNLTWNLGFTAGGGVDLVLPYFNSLFAIRPIQADFQYAKMNYGTLGQASPSAPPNTVGGSANVEAIKLSAGIVMRFGQESAPTPMRYGCTASPAVIFPGDPLTITGNAVNLKPGHKAEYTWTSNGGKLAADGSTATISTSDLAPGDYTVIGHISDGRGVNHQAFCTVPFTVQPFEPPTLACAASPSTVEPGTPVQINCKGNSPQNRPLTYSCVTSGGQITTNGSQATLSTAGLSAGTVTVTCSVVDDLQQTAKSSTVIAITVPPPPPVVETKQLCSIGFSRDKRRPMRVDNEAKGCLDEVALALQQQSDAKLIMVGNFATGEKVQAAEERALNAEQYLTQEKGIDASRITVLTGTAGDKTVTDTLVPAGATFKSEGTQPFNSSEVVRHGPAYGVPGAKRKPAHHHHKKAAKAAAAK